MPHHTQRSSEQAFPILQAAQTAGRPPTIPWALIAPHEKQAKANHGDQSLGLLANRGGLSPEELWCVLHDQPWREHPGERFAEGWLQGLVEGLNSV